MANPDKPFGARLVGHVSGSAYNAQIRRYSVPASDGTALFVGDFVVSGGSADTDGVPDCIAASAGGNLLGVVVAFEPVATNLETMHRLASTLRYALVCDDPYAIFQIQEDSTTDAAGVLVAEIGNNTEIVADTAGNTTSGQSGMELDSDVTGTGTAQLRILGVAQLPGNEIGANCIYNVMINEHEHKSTTGT